MTEIRIAIDPLHDTRDADFGTWLAGTEPEWFREYLQPTADARGRHLQAQFAAASADSSAIAFAARAQDGCPLAAIAIRRLDWDSRHFGAECARIAPYCLARGIDRETRRAVHASLIDSVLDWAKDRRFKLLQRRLLSTRIEEIGCLEARGFRLADRVVTLTVQSNSRPMPPDAPAGVAFRPATSDDLPKLSRMTRNAFPYSRFIHDPVLDPERGRAVYVAWLEAVVTGDSSGGEKTNADARVLVCTSGDDIAGYAVVKRDQRLDELVDRKLGLLELFAIDQEYRGRGLGSALLHHVVGSFAADGVDTVEASTWSDSADSVGLYEKAGFTVRESLNCYHYDVG